ncbi:MAG: hypothetical protein LBH06_00845 [Rikenellaceae bacterium]|nr:hypothetical protein [Rikenellaceae bacterium]
MSDIHKKVLRKFHALCTAAGVTADAKRAMIEHYGVESSADVDTHDLIDLCNALSKQANPRAAELDRLRKRAMAAIGAWLVLTGRESNATVIKAIACRATGFENFNRIPAERLRNVYNTFVNKRKDAAAVERITGGQKQAAQVAIIPVPVSATGKHVN